MKLIIVVVRSKQNLKFQAYQPCLDLFQPFPFSFSSETFFCLVPSILLFYCLNSTVLLPQFYCFIPSILLFSYHHSSVKSLHSTVLFPPFFCFFPSILLIQHLHSTVLFPSFFCLAPSILLLYFLHFSFNSFHSSVYSLHSPAFYSFFALTHKIIKTNLNEKGLISHTVILNRSDIKTDTMQTM